MTQKTFSAKPTDVTRAWYLIDASSAPLGRVATQIATLLTGKAKPQFTKHIDCGDFVVVINAANIKVTGDKMITKKYYHHSGFPGGLRERTLAEQMELNPAKALEHAVRGMLPVNKLRDDRLGRLKIYADADHKHEAQTPQAVVVTESKEGK